MQYIALIYGDDSQCDVEMDVLMEQYGTYSQEIIANGQFKSGEALQPADTATCVRVRDGKTSVTDGPFVESKEQLGGYYLLECANLDEAVESASRIPSARYGTVEVRPVMVFDQS